MQKSPHFRVQTYVNLVAIGRIAQAVSITEQKESFLNIWN